MDLDTKWTKYKYSNFNKCLCVFIACFMLAQAFLNVIPAVKCLMIFREKAVSTEDTSIYDYNSFYQLFNSDVELIFNEANYDYNSKEDYALKEKIIAETVNRYNIKSEAIGYTHKEAVDEFGENFESEYYCYVGDNNLLYFDEAYPADFTERIVVDEKTAFNFHIDMLGRSDDSIIPEFEEQYWDQRGRTYIEPEKPHYSERLGLKNIKYYVEHKDGTVVTNVENKESFIADISNKDYVAVKNGKTQYSEKLDTNKIHAFIPNATKNIASAYFLIDTNFPEDDKYSAIYKEFVDAKDINFNQTIIAIVIFSLLTLTFMVFSIRLAGRKDSELVEFSWIDKVPNDIHFILSAAAGGGLGFFCIWLVVNLSNPIMFNESEIKFSPDFYDAIVVSAAIVTYFIVLEYLTSLARKIKSNEKILKNTLIYKFTKWSISTTKKILRKLKTVCKNTHNKAKKYFNTISFIPNELQKRAIIYAILFVLVNLFFAFVGSGFLFATNGTIILFGLFLLVCLFAIDAYIIYKVAKYLKYLDMIITASKIGNALDIDVNLLPVSLRTLAEGLEKTNTELDMAIRKAVKDERTKTELITNVSHDLKTPLTSVINYIDLLKKCDIQDETAKKYMDVIDEKSIKLKRLIEDLIEASKVTTGNVTLNKTMINLYELAMQAVVEETSDIEKAGLNIIFDETSDEHIVFADGTKVYRVFENLLTNARKYSAPNSRIYAKVYSDGKFGCFEIKNVSKDALNITAEELTERFVRGDKSRNQDGNGLGLSIAKELCRLNGGDLIISIDGDLFKATVKLPKTE